MKPKPKVQPASMVDFFSTVVNVEPDPPPYEPLVEEEADETGFTNETEFDQLKANDSVLSQDTIRRPLCDMILVWRKKEVDKEGEVM